MRTVLVLLAICVCARSSGVEHVVPAPVVTAASSQYFQRTFNRLVVAPVLETPVVVAQTPVVSKTAIVPLPAAAPANPPGATQPVDPNVAIAIATAHAAPPINTFIFPAFPAAPSTTNFLAVPPITVTPKNKPREEVTPRTPRVTTIRTTAPPPPPRPEVNQGAAASSSNTDFLPLPSGYSPSNVDVLSASSSSKQNNNFNEYSPPVRRPLPADNILNKPYPPKNDVLPVPAFSDPNNNFNRYGAPIVRPFSPNNYNNNFNFKTHIPQTYSRPQKLQTPVVVRPQKLRTSVEIVPVPLAYISPPPPVRQHHLKHIHTFVPSKIVVRPSRYYTSSRPARLQIQSRSFDVGPPQITLRRGPALRNPLIPRDIEPTTFSPFPRPNTRPPKI